MTKKYAVLFGMPTPFQDGTSENNKIRSIVFSHQSFKYDTVEEAEADIKKLLSGSLSNETFFIVPIYTKQ